MNRQFASVHEGKKPFKCDFCDYSCSLKNKMQHVASVHEGKKPFKCDICDYYICSQKNAMNQHGASVHDKTKRDIFSNIL